MEQFIKSVQISFESKITKENCRIINNILIYPSLRNINVNGKMRCSRCYK